MREPIRIGQLDAKQRHVVATGKPPTPVYCRGTGAVIDKCDCLRCKTDNKEKS